MWRGAKALKTGGAALALGAGLLCAQIVPAQAIAVSCQAFMSQVQKSVPDLKPQFVRPVVVARRGALFGNEVRDLITNLRLDGQLFCDGDRFVRFEMKMHAPFAASLTRGAARIELAAASFKLQWSSSRTARVLADMRLAAADRLRAAAQRDDVFFSGKVEEHAGEAGDVAMVWTRSDRTFILVEYRP